MSLDHDFAQFALGIDVEHLDITTRRDLIGKLTDFERVCIARGETEAAEVVRAGRVALEGK